MEERRYSTYVVPFLDFHHKRARFISNYEIECYVKNNLKEDREAIAVISPL